MGRVAILRFGLWVAFSINSAKRCRAISRFRACDLDSSARMMIAPSVVHFRPASLRRRDFTYDVRLGLRAASNRSSTAVETLFTLLYAEEGFGLTIDLEACSIQLPDGALWSFSVDAFRRDCLLKGLDDIGLTLQSAEAIRQFEQRHENRFPWLFRDITL